MRPTVLSWGLDLASATGVIGGGGEGELPCAGRRRCAASASRRPVESAGPRLSDSRGRAARSIASRDRPPGRDVLDAHGKPVCAPEAPPLATTFGPRASRRPRPRTAAHRSVVERPRRREGADPPSGPGWSLSARPRTAQVPNSAIHGECVRTRARLGHGTAGFVRGMPDRMRPARLPASRRKQHRGATAARRLRGSRLRDEDWARAEDRPTRVRPAVRRIVQSGMSRSPFAVSSS